MIDFEPEGHVKSASRFSVKSLNANKIFVACTKGMAYTPDGVCFTRAKRILAVCGMPVYTSTDIGTQTNVHILEENPVLYDLCNI